MVQLITVSRLAAFRRCSEYHRLPPRFWAKVREHETSGCWIWIAALNPSGYGQYHHDGRCRTAYRVAYEAIIGGVPAGLELDHTCRQRSCVNPSHLEAVTHAVNMERSLPFRRPPPTHCPNGHEFAPGTTYTERRQNGRSARRCRTCLTIAQRLYRKTA